MPQLVSALSLSIYIYVCVYVCISIAKCLPLGETYASAGVSAEDAADLCTALNLPEAFYNACVIDTMAMGAPSADIGRLSGYGDRNDSIVYPDDSWLDNIDDGVVEGVKWGVIIACLGVVVVGSGMAIEHITSKVGGGRRRRRRRKTLAFDVETIEVTEDVPEAVDTAGMDEVLDELAAIADGEDKPVEEEDVRVDVDDSEEADD
ncbi:hypothetical protein KIPB_005467 [Kipferlia bialata]|uniref:Uncharacterized protein n=1 Tax=Kipferlia bialata TaxID=797122 RepID=A0A9K3GJ27_9EUKA|nr:hypothetical protein KIPB_005467 [Kipferlia bialata]|eukprot:g5467.t1